METTLKMSLFSLFIHLILLATSPVMSLKSGGDSSKLQTYIIRVRPPPQRSDVSNTNVEELDRWYRSFLPRDPVNYTADRMVYSYRDAITGFAARLTESEVEEMATIPGFLKAFPDRRHPLATTHTPTFLGLQQGTGIWNSSNFGEGIIIGVIDTGVESKHPSFNDDGMPPPPAKWKGSCEPQLATCNRKLVGAKSFIQSGGGGDDDDGGDYDDGDEQGIHTNDDDNDGYEHGTHTASTVAGNFVNEANVLGIANGTAVGMAPRAHLAVYRVCNGYVTYGCAQSDVLAGMDAAIADGVDVMSLSLDVGATPFHDNVIAIGAFSAIEKGIFVSCAAGNLGPEPATVASDAPWILTVGASTMDRNIRSTVKLGDGQEINGETAFQPRDSPVTPLPLVYPVPPDGGRVDCSYQRGFDGIDVKGKVVLCDRSYFGVSNNLATHVGINAKKAGAAAMIVVNGYTNGHTTFAEVHPLPASHVNHADGQKIIDYTIASNLSANASIVFKGTITGVSPAPVVAEFSSRGPSKITPGILKPDIIGPGVNVLAAGPFRVGPPLPDGAKVNFNIYSGTSMATPHLSGIAALVKVSHPEWSPAAIKSAIMTTSYTVCPKDGKPIKDEQLQPASFFQMGAGHVDPTKAADPGLIYDLGVDDYIAYLCGMGYTDVEMETVTRRRVSCAKMMKLSEAELNYPAIAVVTSDSKVVAVNRTVTNVGKAGDTYKARVEMPAGVTVSVEPAMLEFKKANEQMTFMVKIDWRETKISHAEGNLEWISDKHVVRSPIVIYKNIYSDVEGAIS